MKKAYINHEILIELNNFGYQGKLMSRLWDDDDVDAGFVMLNTIAALHPMYPVVPFTPFTHFDVSETCMIVIGGMPMMNHIEKWEGEAYSYERKSGIINKFHHCIAAEKSAGWDANKMDPSNNKILCNGVLMLHDVLSISKSHEKECKIAWEPFIWLLLREMTIDNPKIPIVFTSSKSYMKFRRAVTSSKHLFNICLDEDKELASSGQLTSAETLSRKIASPGFKLDLLRDAKG